MTTVIAVIMRVNRPLWGQPDIYWTSLGAMFYLGATMPVLESQGHQFIAV